VTSHCFLDRQHDIELLHIRPGCCPGQDYPVQFRGNDCREIGTDRIGIFKRMDKRQQGWR